MPLRIACVDGNTATRHIAGNYPGFAPHSNSVADINKTFGGRPEALPEFTAARPVSPLRPDLSEHAQVVLAQDLADDVVGVAARRPASP